MHAGQLNLVKLSSERTLSWHEVHCIILNVYLCEKLYKRFLTIPDKCPYSLVWIEWELAEALIFNVPVISS